jgi:predicted ester cyclase
MEKSKEIVRRAIEEIYNKNNTAEVDENYADGYVFHCTTGPEIHSPEGVKELIQRRRAVLPNATITIEDQVAEADKVVTRWTMRDAQQQQSAVPANGDQVTAAGILIDRIADGKIQESWGEENWQVRGVDLMN